jgi:DNA-binding MurR/RpiR family transcriptional regulator
MEGRSVQKTNDLELLLKSKHPHLSRTEKRIVRYILARPGRAAALGITALAERTGTSTASVSRLCSRFGFGSFKRFQLALMQSVSSRPPDAELELFGDDAPSDLIRKAFALNSASLEDTERLLDKPSVVKVARWIAGARRAVFFGVGGSGAIATDAEIHLNHLGIHAASCSDPHTMIILSAGLSARDVALGISHSGQSRNVIEAVKRSKRAGARTACITNYIDSALAKAADLVLLTSFREREISSARSSSRIAQLGILDAIYFLVSQIKADAVKPIVQKIEREVKKTIRKE